jgi:outer membrane protein assembly factor BamE (lipoprotein component of BamABCDE complex)
MKRRVSLLLLAGMLFALVLPGCATQRVADGTELPLERIEQAVIAGQTSKAQILAALGPTTNVRFDSGYEVWLYNFRPQGMAPATDSGLATDGEFVILFDPQGIVRKTRRREPGFKAP